MLSTFQAGLPENNTLHQSSTCPQANQPHTKTRCANNEILKIFTSWWQQTELKGPRFQRANMNRTCHHGDRGRQRVLFSDAFGLPNPMLQGERAEQKIKVVKDSAMFRELTTNMKTKKQHTKKQNNYC